MIKKARQATKALEDYLQYINTSTKENLALELIDYEIADDIIGTIKNCRGELANITVALRRLEARNG